ncbi:hypothetical protein PG990_005727 [Apiospora arundinis]|uniref:Oxidase ustYa n=1 Tax=Apiospora arundinis TaxID=335852 RepID=A0ABR2J9R5_9PEZI
MANNQRDPKHYESLRADDNDDVLSDLDVFEKDYIQQPRPRRDRVIAALRIQPYRWLLDIVLLLAVIGLLVERHHRGGAAAAECQSADHRYEGAGDLTGFAPQFNQQIKSFSPDPLYMPDNTSEFFTREVKQKWLDLVPPGLGYVKINNTEKYDNLPTPLVGYGEDFVATTSMTHQLHCLYAIAETYAALTSNSTAVLMETWHMNHCFDYLRQSIMCCGDVALEGEQTTFPEGFDGSDGWDAKHVCKDYTEVYSYLEKNAVNNQTWI